MIRMDKSSVLRAEYITKKYGIKSKVRALNHNQASRRFRTPHLERQELGYESHGNYHTHAHGDDHGAPTSHALTAVRSGHASARRLTVNQEPTSALKKGNFIADGELQ